MPKVLNNKLANTRPMSNKAAGSDITVLPDGPSIERLVKSVERVRDIGEVFTPASTVQAMLDLLPKAMWTPHPSATFLEPACGDGNFLVAILYRKLENVSRSYAKGKLPAGSSVDSLQFHALEALSSIYGVDISADNVIGGTPGHEIGARHRLLMILRAWYHEVVGVRLPDRSAFLSSANWILERNIIVGNMLATDADGNSSGREKLPLVEYDWNPKSLTVDLRATTLGAATTEADSKRDGQVSFFEELFGQAIVWSGTALDIRKAPISPPPIFSAEARNGNRRRAG